MEQHRSSHFIRRDAARNMNRFYRLTVTRDLFGTVVLVREWGRIGVYCRTRFDTMADEGEAARHGGRMLPLHLTPYIIALPYRIAAFERLIAGLKARPTTWFAPPGDIVTHLMENGL